MDYMGDDLEEISSYISLINMDILEHMCICKGYQDLTTKICLKIQEHGFNLRKIQSHLLDLSSDYSIKLNFLDKIIRELQDEVKLENNIIPYGPAHVAHSVCKRILKKFEGETKLYLEKLTQYLYLIGRYINQNLRVYGEQICIN